MAHKDIIIKTCSSPIVLLQSREDEGTPTSQNTIHNTATFTHPAQNPPKRTPPPENSPYTQPIGHHSLKPPHTTPPLQNQPTKQPPQQHSPPHVHSMKPPHTTPPLQNQPTEQAPLQRSPPHVHSLKSSPHTIPPLQIPPNAPKKQDATLDKTSKDPKTILDKVYDGLKNYKTKKPLEDLALVVMSVEEFLQHGDKDIQEFEHGKPLVPKHVHLKFPWIMQKLHELYYLACVYVMWTSTPAIHPHLRIIRFLVRLLSSCAPTKQSGILVRSFLFILFRQWKHVFYFVA
jgi:hypothetical protein